MRKFLKNREADLNVVLSGVVIAIALAVGIIITFNVIASVDTGTIDADLTGTPALNSTVDLLGNVETFYTVAPITLIVIAAVAIIGYVMLLRRR